MIRNFLFILLLSITPLIAAQNKSQEIINFTKDVSNLISYYSEVVGYYQSRPPYMSEYNIQLLKQNKDATLYYIDPQSTTEKEDNKSNIFSQLQNRDITFPEKDDLIESINTAITKTNEVKNNCNILSKYFSNKEYLDDSSFSSYQMKITNYQQSVIDAYELWRKASSLNDEIKDNTETNLLKTKKISSFIIPMKEDMDDLKLIVNQVYSQDFSVIILKMDVNNLDTLVEIHKKTANKDITKLKDPSYLDVYNRFYDNMSDCNNTVEKIIECVENKNFSSTLDNLLDKLNEQYNKVIEDYKLFASQD